MVTKQALWETPEPSTSSVSGFVLTTDNGKGLELHFDYDREGRVFTSGIRFLKVRAYRHRAELYTTQWHTTDAYDTLVEVKPSQWVDELVADASVDRRHDWIMRHFMITFDSAGCYEIVAGAWEAIPEVEARLSSYLLEQEA